MEKKGNPHRKKQFHPNGAAPVQENATERREEESFTGKTLGTKEEGCKGSLAPSTPEQNSTVNAFKAESFLGWWFFVGYFFALLGFFLQLKAEEKLVIKASVSLDRVERESLRLKKK